MRVLVAIANHGTKNDRYLARLLESYGAMSFDVDVVVMSNLAKDLGPDVEVHLGAPTADPRSLPFAHRTLFAERRGQYDLYIYTEDDTLIREEHVAAFLEASRVLPEHLVAGFMRYELHPDGTRSYCTIHSAYYWDPTTVVEYGGELFARFSNAHSACFMLTRSQLETAIESGGFLVAPHAGRYAMLEAAATDPYVGCGLTKLICFSKLDAFLLHHLPNLYLGKLGITEAELTPQLDALRGVLAGRVRTDFLFQPMGLTTESTWDKFYYEPAWPAALERVPDGCRSVLSIGTGSGRLEATLARPDRNVTVVPIDAIIGALAASRGLEVLVPDLEQALESLAGRRFDCVLLINVLQYFPDPARVLELVRRHLTPDGHVVVSARNPAYFNLRARLYRHNGRAAAGDFPFPTHRRLRGWLARAGLRIASTDHTLRQRAQSLSRASMGLFDRWIGTEIFLSARPGRAPRA